MDTRRQHQQQLEGAWQAAAGDYAAVSRPVVVKNGVLLVLTNHCVITQELHFVKRKIIRSLQEALPDMEIRDLWFRVGVVEPNHTCE